MKSVRPYRRIVLIVLDGVGVGELPDAADFGDVGSNSLGNLINERGYLNVPNLCSLGLGKISTSLECDNTEVRGGFGKCAEIGPSKDSTGGHWEMMCHVLDRPFPVFPNGFPEGLITRFEEITGRKTLGNKAASGTEIITELGERAESEKALIVYTSADSVFQVAAHTGAIPLDELYRYCESAREMLSGEFKVGRVIARPFEGTAPEYYRTDGRKDYSLPPEGKTVLDALYDKGFKVFGVGKIYDLFAGRGLSSCTNIRDNETGVNRIIELLATDFIGLIFANLNDTDTKYGHRNDIEGYARAIENFDSLLPKITETLREDDLLIITSDHGNDPTTPSTDHSREYTPLFVWHKKINKGIRLGTRTSFADVGKTIAENFGVEFGFIGTGFLYEIL